MMNSVPNLDDLAAQPELAQALSAEVAIKLHWQCVSVLHALMVPLMNNGHKNSLPPVATDTLLGPKEVAQMIGMSVSWVEKYTKELPPRVSLVGHPRWRKGDIERWMKNLPEYGKAT